MHFSSATIALVASLASVQGALLGFNYGATKSDGYTPMLQADFQTLFQKAQNLPGTSGWTAARLYTSIQSGTSPSEAFAAAIATNTKLLLGLWGSSGDQTITSEIAAINSAITQFGSKFTSLVIGISVGSEDLYRTSEIGIKNKSGVGADPTSIANYIKQTKQAFAGSALSGVPVGHVDTWTAWYNTSNQAVIDASDFIGVDAYPYFENTVTNSIENSRGLFDIAIANVKSTVGGKEIWVTETGFPVAGPVSNLATPSAQDAKKYWDDVGCGELFNVTNTFWYTLEDNYGGSLSSSAGPVFGVLDSNGSPVFDLSCKGVSSNPSSSASVSGTASATNIGDGSPAVSGIPSGVISASGASSASSASVTSSAGSVSGSVSGTGSSGSGASATASITAVSSFSSTLVTNSAGQTITSSVMVNGTGSGTGPSTGTPISPTSSVSPSTGAANHGAAPVAGLFGALLAAFALL